ncbi:glycosyltransferase family 4 protein [Rhodococcus daqingensis]|uniref:Glycosyltransferase family 4 protein n=1 Tax=Rhodococcus daqingensis TaxID=2479363 RepID=A0ABW2RS29_9NOCA
MRSSATQIRFGALALRPGGSGVQTYARELLTALTPELRDAELSALVQSDAVGELPAAVTAVRRPVAGGAVRAALGALPIGRCDLFHSLDVDLPIATRAVTVSTVHDLSVLDVPWASSRLRAAGESLLVRSALRRADVLLAVSEFTAERIHAVSGRTATVVELAPAPWARPPAPDQVERLRARLGLPERFVLQVGTVEPRKDVRLVADVADELGVPCVLAGAGTRGPDAPTGAIGLGYVDVADLPGLYAAATVTAYASKYEGYGLPPVEAMACGGAVVASAVGALPQVVGAGAVLVDSLRAADWVSAMRPLIHEPAARAELTAEAVRVAGKLTWARTAERTARAYRDAGVSW